MIKNILRFNLWRLVLAVGIGVYYLKAIQVAIERDDILTAACLTPFCVPISIYCVVRIVMYIIHIFKCDIYTYNSDIKNCKKCFANCHYFFGDYLITMEIPAKIYYGEIHEICTYKRGRVFYIDIRTKDCKKYTLKQFSKNGNLFDRGDECYDNHNQMMHLILMMNGNIRLERK